MQKYQNQRERERESLAPRNIYMSATNICTTETNVQYLDVQIQGRQNATMVSVCVKGTARADKQCIKQ